MPTGVGQKIEAQHYNDIQGIINPILGRSYNPFNAAYNLGYDNVPVASQVAQLAIISAQQWANLRTDISRARGHQTGTDLLAAATPGALTVPNPSVAITATISGTTMTVTAVTGGNIQLTSELTFTTNGQPIGGAGTKTTIVSQTSGTSGSTGNYTISRTLSIGVATAITATLFVKISEADRSAYQVMAEAARDNRLIGPGASINQIPGTRSAVVNLFTPSVRTAVWNGTVQETITVRFPAETSGTVPNTQPPGHIRAFFNTGGEILFSASFVPNNSETKNTSWQTLCSQLGTIRFGRDAIDAGSNTSITTVTTAAVGYSNLTQSGSPPALLVERKLVQVTTNPPADVGNYFPNSIRLYGFKTLNSGGYDILTFYLQFRDDAAADTPPTPAVFPDTPIDEDVNGTLTSTVSCRYAANATYIQVSPPTSANTGSSTTGIV